MDMNLIGRERSRPLMRAVESQVRLEKKIWEDFWNIANDSDRAKELGIRAAHGDAVSIKVRKGKSYKVTLRATGDLTLQPDDGAPVRGPQT